MAEIIRSLHKVQELPESQHWFCPKDHNDDEDYLPEDIGDLKHTDEKDASVLQKRDTKIQEASARKKLVFESLQIFAFDGPDAAQLQTWLEQHLAKQMSQCAVCVREFHRGRQELKTKLEGSYDEDEVSNFLQRFDEINIRRIKAGLERASQSLLAVPEQNRGLRQLDSSSLHAIFEALNCTPFLSNEELLVSFFDEPFNLVQQKAKLKLGNYPPALTYFLFGQNAKRISWAKYSWGHIKRNITASEFEWSVRIPLFKAMLRVQLHDLDKGFLPQFWAGVRSILMRIDKRMFTDHLRAMDLDISKLAFEHLQVDSDDFEDLLGSVNRILSISPNDFWEALGATPPVVFVEQFFNSPALKRLLLSVRDDEAAANVFKSLFSWVVPFMTSMKSVAQVSTCRAFLSQLLETFQYPAYPQVIRSSSLSLGLQLLKITLINLNKDGTSIGGRPIRAEALEVVERHITAAIVQAKGKPAEDNLCAEVLGQALSLDCRCLRFDGADIASENPAQHGSCTYFPKIWDQALHCLDRGNIAYAKNIFLGLKTLVGLEKFVIKRGNTLPKEQERFNQTFDALNKYITEFLERSTEISQMDLRRLFETPTSIDSMISLLFSSDSTTRQAAIELFKAVSGHIVRRDALAFLVDSLYVDFIDALSLSLRRIEFTKAFSPAPGIVKTCSDVMTILCNSQDGVLRSRELNFSEVDATSRFWQSLWLELISMFRSTEIWSTMGHDKDLIFQFCRDLMEFAGLTFDQFPVLQSVLQDQSSSSSVENEQKVIGKRLLEKPRLAMEVIVGWLKLRDDLLLSKANGLVCTLLIRLKEFESSVDKLVLQNIEDMIIGKSRTLLSQQQKAELHRALENHIGQDFIVLDERKVTTLQPGKEIVDLDTYTSKASSDNSSDVSDNSKMIKKSTTTSDDRTKLTKQMNKAPLGKPSVTSNKSVLAQVGARKVPDMNEFMRKREQDRIAKEKEKQEAIARQKKMMGPAGEGSSLQGLGVFGKDHAAPKGAGIMVSSDEEDSDSDDMDQELFGGSTKKPISENVRAYQEAREARKKQQGPVKKQRIVRSTRDMRARLAPDLSAMHRQILAWEYFHEGAFPPKSSKEDYASVLNTFRSPVDYQNTFQPLLLLEAWNGFLKAKEENTAKPFEVKVVNRASVDSFLEVSSNIAHPDAKDLSEGDIILLSKAKSPSGHDASEIPHCLARIHNMTRKKSHVEVLYRVVPGTTLVTSLVPNVNLYGLKITSIIPLEREYGALRGLQYYDLCEEIIKAKPSPILRYEDDHLQPLMRNYGVNKAQAKAIKSAIDNDAFTLIQGPPGSGKTKTIVAIVGATLGNVRLQDNRTISQPKAPNGLPQGKTAAPLAKKILVCAPSNAAVDELVMRLKEGVKSPKGDHQELSVVRLGRSDAINANVLDVTLDELVNKKLNVNPDQGTAREETQAIMKKHQEVSEKLREARRILDEATASSTVTAQMRKDVDDLKRSKALLSTSVDNAKDNESAQSRQADANRRRAQQQIIDQSHVICATLSGSGHEMFQNLNVEFETAIIDEAAQCVELSALIPLKYGCAKCVLVGDPQQLPPTVFSRDAARFKYEQSLFVRMQGNHPQDVHLLDTQYRMHPEISSFPSQAFYDGKLLDGKNMGALRVKPWHASALLSPFRFFDVQGQHQAAPKGHSLINLAEIRVAMRLYSRLVSDFGAYDFKGKIGIITPYKSQLRELKDRFGREFGPKITESIEFNTTDAFQGRESEIIIFSCVRASPSGGIGFLQDIRRMNVGLTRAKSSLWVLGNSDSLSKGEYWSKLLQDARSRQKFTQGNIEVMLKDASRDGSGKLICYDVEDTVMAGSVTRKPSIDMPSKPTAVLAPEKSEQPTAPKPQVEGSSKSSGGTMKRKRPIQDEEQKSSKSMNSNTTAHDVDVDMEDVTKNSTTAVSSAASAEVSARPSTQVKSPTEIPQQASTKPKPPLPPSARRKKADILIRRRP